MSNLKFIIDGKTYDTATSTVAAEKRSTEDFDFGVVQLHATLYRTAKGAFFLHTRSTTHREQDKGSFTDHERSALTPEEAVEWIGLIGATVIDPAGLPLPEAA